VTELLRFVSHPIRNIAFLNRVFTELSDWRSPIRFTLWVWGQPSTSQKMIKGTSQVASLRRVLATFTVLSLCTFSSIRPTSAYSVVTHEAIIDSEWEDQIKTFLLARFPNATPDDLRKAHAYAYGGCVIQDLGYYPFGSRFFSELTHYVRSGDFVAALFEESRDIDDYAFALGALSHYVADIQGHSLAVNAAVPMLYPRLRRKYGTWLTWEENPQAHAMTEFGYDVLEVVARHNAPQAYHDWIGFKVPKPVLQRAFKKTYGLELNDQMLNIDLALVAYRKLASKVIPEMTEVAWVMRKSELESLSSGVHHAQLYHLSRKSYASWIPTYKKPGPGDKITAFLVRLVPKFGSLSTLEFRAPTLQTEQLFADSLKATVEDYEPDLRRAQKGEFDPPNMNLDTGRSTQPGEYISCDRTYAKLLDKLGRSHFSDVSLGLRGNLLSFYSDSAGNTLKREPGKWRKVLRNLNGLKAATDGTKAHPALTSELGRSASGHGL
jgi:hypothetical protein